MHVSSFLAVAISALPHFVYGAPARFYGKRTDADITVLQFANVLEQLETTFYSQALSKFQPSDFTSAGFSSSDVPIQQFQGIQKDEATHTAVLQSALQSLGQNPITSCKFKFDSVLSDVTTMAATARVVELVGVSAYLGAAHLVTNPILLTDAGSILTVEARHQTILNILSGTGTAIPASFDIALSPNEVLAVASPFIDGPCDLGVPANPTLTITNQGSVQPGTLLTFSSSAMNGSTDGMFCQMVVGGSPFSISLPLSQCVVPDGINGPVAIWVTSDNQPLLNDVVDRATKSVVAGPTIAFIDTQPQALSQAAVSNSGSLNNNGNSDGSSNDGSASTSVSTTTISPAEASSIIASAASATQTGSAGATAPAVIAGAVSSVAISAASATATGSAAVPSSSGAAASINPAVNLTPGQPNTFKGTSTDGKITVLGWSNLPAQ